MNPPACDPELTRLLARRAFLSGSALSLLTVASLLAAVVSCGVAVSAVANSALLGVAFLWICLYGTNLLLALLPGRFASPERVLQMLPYVLRGEAYDTSGLLRVIAAATVVSFLAAAVGMAYFARRDV